MRKFTDKELGISKHADTFIAQCKNKKPWRHQLIDLDMANTEQGNLQLIIADGMGLGKTMSSLLLCLRRSPGKQSTIVILCPVNVTAHWLGELWNVARSVPDNIHDFSNCKKRKIELWDEGMNINDDVLGLIVPITKVKSEEGNALSVALETLLQKNPECILVIDEAHLVCMHQNDNTRARNILLLRLLFKHCVLLTGTPMTNSIDEFKSLAILLGRGVMAIPEWWARPENQTKAVTEAKQIMVHRDREMVRGKQEKLVLPLSMYPTLAQTWVDFSLLQNSLLTNRFIGAREEACGPEMVFSGRLRVMGNKASNAATGKCHVLTDSHTQAANQVAACITPMMAAFFLVPDWVRNRTPSTSSAGLQHWHVNAGATRAWDYIPCNENAWTHVLQPTAVGAATAVTKQERHLRAWRYHLAQEATLCIYLADREAEEVGQRKQLLKESRVDGKRRKIMQDTKPTTGQRASARGTAPTRRRSPAFTQWAEEEYQLRRDGSDGDQFHGVTVQKLQYCTPSPWALVTTSSLLQVLLTYIPCHMWRGEKAVLYVERLHVELIRGVLQMYIRYMTNLGLFEIDETTPANRQTQAWDSARCSNNSNSNMPLRPSNTRTPHTQQPALKPRILLYHGGLDTLSRADILGWFRTQPARLAPLLIVTEAGGTGVNVPEGNITFITMAGFNERNQKQARFRCDRIDQPCMPREIPLNMGLPYELVVTLLHFIKAYEAAALMQTTDVFARAYPTPVVLYWNPKDYLDARLLAKRIGKDGDKRLTDPEVLLRLRRLGRLSATEVQELPRISSVVPAHSNAWSLHDDAILLAEQTTARRNILQNQDAFSFLGSTRSSVADNKLQPLVYLMQLSWWLSKTPQTKAVSAASPCVSAGSDSSRQTTAPVARNVATSRVPPTIDQSGGSNHPDGCGKNKTTAKHTAKNTSADDEACSLNENNLPPPAVVRSVGNLLPLRSQCLFDEFIGRAQRVFACSLGVTDSQHVSLYPLRMSKPQVFATSVHVNTSIHAHGTLYVPPVACAKNHTRVKAKHHNPTAEDVEWARDPLCSQLISLRKTLLRCLLRMSDTWIAWHHAARVQSRHAVQDISATPNTAQDYTLTQFQKKGSVKLKSSLAVELLAKVSPLLATGATSTTDTHSRDSTEATRRMKLLRTLNSMILTQMKRKNTSSSV
jgi:hypothetical protein